MPFDDLLEDMVDPALAPRASAPRIRTTAARPVVPYGVLNLPRLRSLHALPAVSLCDGGSHAAGVVAVAFGCSVRLYILAMAALWRAVASAMARQMPGSPDPDRP